MKALLKFSFLSIAVSAICLSCNTSNDNNFPYAHFIIVHASPDAPGIDLFAGSSQIDTNQVFGEVRYDYAAQPSYYHFQFAQHTDGKILVDENINFDGLKYYSIFMADSLSKFKTVITTDDFSALPTGDSVKIRFLDFSPDASPMDIVTESGDTLYLNRSFNDAPVNSALQTFMQIPAGNYMIDMKQAGTENILTSKSVTLTAGKFYTLWAKGFEGATTSEQQLDLSVIEHRL